MVSWSKCLGAGAVGVQINSGFGPVCHSVRQAGFGIDSVRAAAGIASWTEKMLQSTDMCTDMRTDMCVACMQASKTNRKPVASNDHHWQVCAHAYAIFHTHHRPACNFYTYTCLCKSQHMSTSMSVHISMYVYRIRTICMECISRSSCPCTTPSTRLRTTYA